jgi:hypothetical protein
MSESKRETIYALSLQGHEAIGVDIGGICWGSCGKGAIGAIDLGENGEAIPCCHVAAECPNLDKEMGKPFGTIEFNGREYDVILRKLRATGSPQGSPQKEEP